MRAHTRMGTVPTVALLKKGYVTRADRKFKLV